MMEESGNGPSDYYKEAMGNFIHEMSGAGAIRHMVDQGYAIRQIMERLDYPTPQGRVEETALKHMLKQGILLEQLPGAEQEVLKSASAEKSALLPLCDELDALKGASAEKSRSGKFCEERQKENGYHRIRISPPYDRKQISEAVFSRREQNGEAFSYVLLPIDQLKKDKELPACLTDREWEYICGLPWKAEAAGRRVKPLVYHRLTGRMYEIAMELAMAVRDEKIKGFHEICFYFLKSKEELCVGKK